MKRKNEDGTQKNTRNFKTHFEAIKTADKECPVSPELLESIKIMHNYPLQTKNDFRFFVLFNMIKSIDLRINNDLENVYLQRIQDNILLSAEKYLKS